MTNLNQNKKIVPFFEEGDVLVEVSYFKEDTEISNSKIFNISNMHGKKLYVRDTIWAMHEGLELEIERYQVESKDV